MQVIHVVMHSGTVESAGHPCCDAPGEKKMTVNRNKKLNIHAVGAHPLRFCVDLTVFLCHPNREETPPPQEVSVNGPV